jgi:predicted nucleic acid-binding protein
LPREVEIFLDAVVAMAGPVKTYFLWRRNLRDPGDEMVLETAVNGQTDALVTFSLRDLIGCIGKESIRGSRNRQFQTIVV